MKKNKYLTLMVIMLFVVPFSVLGKQTVALWGDSYADGVKAFENICGYLIKYKNNPYVAHFQNGDFTAGGKSYNWDTAWKIKNVKEACVKDYFFMSTSNHDDGTEYQPQLKDILPSNGSNCYYYHAEWDIPGSQRKLHLFVLDGWMGVSASEQMTYFKPILAKTKPSDWMVLLYHQPTYPGMSYNDPADDIRNNAIQIFQDAGADFAFTGHAHQYRRSHLLSGASGTKVQTMSSPGGSNVTSDETNGMIHIVNGRGGVFYGGTRDTGSDWYGNCYAPTLTTSDSIGLITTMEFDDNVVTLRTIKIGSNYEEVGVQDSWTWTRGEPMPVISDPAFTSADTISLPANTSKGYKITYNDASCSVVVLQKPSWTRIKNDSVAIYAPKSSCVDSMVFQLKNSSGTPVDTLVLKITVTGGVGIVNNGSETNVLGIFPQISSGKSGFNITLPITGKYSIDVYDISGKEVWKYQSVASVAGNQYIAWGNVATNRNLLRNKIYFAVLRQGDKKITTKLNFIK